MSVKLNLEAKTSSALINTALGELVADICKKQGWEVAPERVVLKSIDVTPDGRAKIEVTFNAPEEDTLVEIKS